MKVENIPRPKTAVVLAGGLGTRLRAAVADLPKVLAPAGGRPFLDYVLRFLSRQGIKQVYLSVGYRAEQVKKFARDGRPWELRIDYIQEETPLGTGGALRLAAQRLGAPFFAFNGDTLFFCDLNTLWLDHIRMNSLATLALLPVEDGRERGVVQADPTGRITSFLEKPDQSGSTLVSGGTYVLTPASLAAIRPGAAASIEKDVFPALAARGLLGGSIQSGYFADIGTPDSLAGFEADIQAGKIEV